MTDNHGTGQLLFGVVTDIAEACAESRAKYEPLRNVLPLDFGLSTLFAGDDGALLGWDWRKALRAYDHRIAGGGTQAPRDSARYREAVAALRGWIRTEVGVGF